MIINQQRAHIRILFDRYMAQIENRKNASQRMLFPDMVHFSPSEVPVLEEFMDDLNALGFDLSSLGGGTYSINGIPAGIEGLNPEKLVTDMVQTAIEKGCKVKEEVQSMLALSLAKAAAIASVSSRNPGTISGLIHNCRSNESPLRVTAAYATVVIPTPPAATER